MLAGKRGYPLIVPVGDLNPQLCQPVSKRGVWGFLPYSSAIEALGALSGYSIHISKVFRVE